MSSDYPKSNKKKKTNNNILSKAQKGQNRIKTERLLRSEMRMNMVITKRQRNMQAYVPKQADMAGQHSSVGMTVSRPVCYPSNSSSWELRW